MKKIFLIFILIVCLSLVSCKISHIEDINGDENFELATLKKEEIFTYNSNINVGSITKEYASSFTYTCKKLSGNYLINTLTPNNRTLQVDIEFVIKKGNAFLALVCDGKVYHEIKPNTFSSYDISGDKDVQLRILGESCVTSVSVNIQEK